MIFKGGNIRLTLYNETRMRKWELWIVRGRERSEWKEKRREVRWLRGESGKIICIMHHYGVIDNVSKYFTLTLYNQTGSGNMSNRLWRCLCPPIEGALTSRGGPRKLVNKMRIVFKKGHRLGEYAGGDGYPIVLSFLTILPSPFPSLSFSLSLSPHSLSLSLPSLSLSFPLLYLSPPPLSLSLSLFLSPLFFPPDFPFDWRGALGPWRRFYATAFRDIL